MQPTEVRSGSKHVLAFVLIFVFLLAVSIFMVLNMQNRIVITKENVQVKNTDLKSVTNQADKLPGGFPNFIPVETAQVTESYSMNFPDRKLTQYTVNFTSAKTLEQKHKEYSDFMNANGFVLKPGSDTETTRTLYASKNNDDLLVVLSMVGKETTVQIAYVDRQ